MVDGKIKISLFVAFYGRLELTNYVFSYYHNLKNKLKDYCVLDLICVGSEGEYSKQVAINNGFNYFEYPNNPLSYKFNYACSMCENFNPDALIAIGSDDILSYEFFMFYIEAIKNGVDFCGIIDMYMLVKDSLIYWGGYDEKSNRLGETIGAGRLFSRKLIEMLEWKPWNGEARDRGLDGLCTNNLAKLKYNNTAVKCLDVNGYILDIKTKNNLTNPIRIKNKIYQNIDILSKWGLDIDTIEHLLLDDKKTTNKKKGDLRKKKDITPVVELIKITQETPILNQSAVTKPEPLYNPEQPKKPKQTKSGKIILGPKNPHITEPVINTQTPQPTTPKNIGKPTLPKNNVVVKPQPIQQPKTEPTPEEIKPKQSMSRIPNETLIAKLRKSKLRFGSR